MSKEYIQEQPKSQAEEKTEAQIFEEQDKTEHISESMLGSHKMYAAAEDDSTPSIERRLDTSTETLGETKSKRVTFETDPELEAQVAAEREKYEKEQAKKDAAKKEARLETVMRPKPRQEARILEEEPVDDKKDIEDQKQLNSSFYLAQTLGGIGAMAWFASLTPLASSDSTYNLLKIAFYALSFIALAVLIFSILRTRARTVPETMTWPFVMATLAPGYAMRLLFYEVTTSAFSGNTTVNTFLGITFWAIAACIHYFCLNYFRIKPPVHLAVTYFLMMILYLYMGIMVFAIENRNIELFGQLFTVNSVVRLIGFLAVDLAAGQLLPIVCSKLRSKSQW